MSHAFSTATLTSAVWIVVGTFFLDRLGGDEAPDSPQSARPASEGTVSPRIEAGLTVPVLGASASDLVDSFDQVRGERRHEAIDILAPAGTPREIIDKVRAAVAQAMASPELRASYVASGFEAVGEPPVQFTGDAASPWRTKNEAPAFRSVHDGSARTPDATVVVATALRSPVSGKAPAGGDRHPAISKFFMQRQ